MDNAIDLRLFRYFAVLAETLHFGRAARRLHISQPPLTRQIKLLEDVLGVALFERGKAGVSLTQAGAAFLPEARATLRQADKAVAAARAWRDADSGQFVVGYTTVFDRSAIPDVLDALRERFPRWRIGSKGKHSIALVRDIANGVMDAAFIGLHTAAPGLTVLPLEAEPPLVALASTHRLARKRALVPADLGDETLFWFERRLNPGYDDYARALFDQIGFHPRMTPEPADHHVLLGLVAEGQGVALIPASLRHVKRQGVVYRPVGGELRRLSMGIALAYDAAKPSPLLAPFIALVQGGIEPRALPAV